jgi:hypothetical protein
VIALDHSAHVQARSADEEWNFAARENIVNRRVRALLIIRERQFLVWFNDINQMMRCQRLFDARRFRRRNVHAAINRARIGRDNFAIKFAREF